MTNVWWNNPPGWPKPPPGWRPPVGWSPPEDWPAPPPGWRYWMEEPPKDLVINSGVTNPDDILIAAAMGVHRTPVRQKARGGSKDYETRGVGYYDSEDENSKDENSKDENSGSRGSRGRFHFDGFNLDRKTIIVGSVTLVIVVIVAFVILNAFKSSSPSVIPVSPDSSSFVPQDSGGLNIVQLQGISTSCQIAAPNLNDTINSYMENGAKLGNVKILTATGGSINNTTLVIASVPPGGSLGVWAIPNDVKPYDSAQPFQNITPLNDAAKTVTKVSPNPTDQSNLIQQINDGFVTYTCKQ